MITLGIDLAAQPKRTAMAAIEWSERRAVVAELVVGVDDDAALAAMARAEWTGIDAPFGWPNAFVEAMSAFAERGEWRDGELRLRATDLAVRRITGITPLSVSSDRIAVVAFRCARLLSRLETVDRVVEVYPAAALHQWKIERRGYKGGRAAQREERRAVRERIVAALPDWLDLDADACAASDDALDAVLAALVTRAAALKLTYPPEGDVAREGWIHIPRAGTLNRLP